MEIIIFAVLNAIIWTLLTIKWKDFRRKGVNPISSFSVIGASLPLWILGFFFVSRYSSVVISKEYFISVIIWGVLVILSNLGVIYIIKYQVLSEFKLYSLAVSAFIAVLMDLFFFKIFFDLYKIIGIVLFFAAAFIISKNKKSKRNKEKKLLSVLLIIFFLGVIGVLQKGAYKFGIILQPNPLLQPMFVQPIVFSIFLMFGFRYLKKDYARGLITNNDLIYFGVLIFLFTVFETYLFKELSIVALVLLGVLQLFIYTVYDIFRKDLKLSWKVFLAGVFSVIALVLIRL